MKILRYKVTFEGDINYSKEVCVNDRAKRGDIVEKAAIQLFGSHASEAMTFSKITVQKIKEK